MKNIKCILAAVAMSIASLTAWAAAGDPVSIPTALGSSVDFNNAEYENCTIENEGLNVGSTHSNTVVTFTLINAIEQEYYVKMRTAAKDLTAVLTVTVKNGENELFSTDRNVENTGQWYLADNQNPTYHNFSIGLLPVGTLTFEIKVRSTTGSYAGNYGYLSIHGANQFDQIPSETALNLENGTHAGNGEPRYQDANQNVGYIKNGGYSVYNVYANTSAYSNPDAVYLNMQMDIINFYNAGQVQVSIYDIDDLSTPERQQTFDITATATDKMFAITNPVTPGFKQIRLDYISESDGYIFNYKNLRFVERDDEAGDDPSAVTFGLTRTVAAETSTAPDSQEKYLASAETLVDPSVVGVTLTKDYAHTPQAMGAPAYLNWVDGGVTKECYTSDRSFRTTTNVLDENSYFGISMSIAIGKKVSFKRVISDALRENNMGVTSLHYQIRIYNNGNWIYSLSEVVSTDANLKRSVDVSHVAALQDLTGSVLIKMCVWNDVEPHYARYIDVKDLLIKAIVEDNDAEGENTLSFVSFDGAREPEFTNGSITARWKRGDGYNVTHSSNNRGIRMTENMTLTISVPEDSYISGVVFINNGQGNPNAEGNSFNLAITNAKSETVGSFAEPKSGDEHTWSCGVVRESQLTFTQGTGDFYCNSIRVTYRDKSGLSNYTREHPHMNLNTLCYPYQIDYYTGATFYTMLYKVLDGGVVTDVYLQEHIGPLEAGTPYFYEPEDGAAELVCYYSGDREENPLKVNGVQGSYGDDAPVPSGAFVTYNNMLRIAGDHVTLGEYRAYVDMATVPADGSANRIAGRRLLKMRNSDAPAVATGIGNVQSDKEQTTKILRNGQLIVLRDGKEYNVLGIEL